MKLINFYSLFVLFFLIFIIVSCNKKFSGEWVAKIDRDTITLDELNTYYYAQQKSIYSISTEEIDKLAADPSSVEKNPTLNKHEFLEQLIRQRLVYNEAIKEGLLENEEVDALVQMSKEAVVVGYYVRKKFGDEISISSDDVEKVYSKQRSKFKGVPIEQAELFIKQQLFQQKLQVKIRDLVENLKEQSRIEKNVDMMKDEESRGYEESESKEGKE